MLAQDYPNRPIRVIVTTSPGGISDVFLRALGEALHQRLGQPLVVENRAGGNMIIGARACAEAAPDGYTLCVMPGEPLTYNQFQFKNIPYDPDKSFQPITNFFFLTQTLGVSAKLNVKSLAELAAYSKAHAGTLSYSAPSSSLIVFMEKWKQETGADLVRVPFKGGADTINGILSGVTPVGFLGLGNMISHIARRHHHPHSDRRREELTADSGCHRRSAISVSRATTRARSSGCLRPPASARAGRQAARRDREHRERAFIPQPSHGRARARAGDEYAGGVPPVPDRRSRARREDREGGGAVVAVAYSPWPKRRYFGMLGRSTIRLGRTSPCRMTRAHLRTQAQTSRRRFMASAAATLAAGAAGRMPAFAQAAVTHAHQGRRGA